MSYLMKKVPELPAPLLKPLMVNPSATCKTTPTTAIDHVKAKERFLVLPDLRHHFFMIISKSGLTSGIDSTTIPRA